MDNNKQIKLINKEKGNIMWNKVNINNIIMVILIK